MLNSFHFTVLNHNKVANRTCISTVIILLHPWITASFSSWRPGLNFRAFHTKFLAGKVVLQQVSLQVLASILFVLITIYHRTSSQHVLTISFLNQDFTTSQYILIHPYIDNSSPQHFYILVVRTQIVIYC